MKKLILVLLLFISVNTFAESITVNLSEFAYKKEDVWTSWQKCSVKMVFDIDSDLIEIYSDTYQKFSLKIEEVVEEVDKTVYVFSAVDSNDINCVVTLYFYKETTLSFIDIYYSNFEYMYAFED